MLPRVQQDTSRRFVVIDIAICVILFLTLVGLQPALVDGDGLDIASRAIERGFLEAMEPKHLIISPLLRPIHLALRSLGMEQYDLNAFAVVDHLATVAIYLVLARGLFARFVRDPGIARVCALGSVVSYGVMSRGSTIETYSLALLADVLLVTYCLNADLRRARSVLTIALFSVAAVALHISNILIAPLIVVLIWRRLDRADRVATLARVSAVAVAGAAVLWVLLALGKPTITRVVPHADPEPAQSVTDRLARTAYGMARTIAFLPPVRSLPTKLAVGYAAAMLAAGALFLYVVRRSRGAWAMSRAAMPAVAAFVLPFTAVGIAYYPSDPERWLFFLPLLWLAIGVVWDQYTPSARTLVSRPVATCALGCMVSVLFAYDALVGLLPEAQNNRYLAGIAQANRLVASDDLVISPSGCNGRIYRFYLGEAPRFANMTLMELAESNPADEQAMLQALRARIEGHFGRGKNVYAYHVFGENHRRNEGFPWAHMPNNYAPDTFMSVLEQYDRTELVAPSGTVCGLYRLSPRR